MNILQTLSNWTIPVLVALIVLALLYLLFRKPYFQDTTVQFDRGDRDGVCSRGSDYTRVP